VKAAIRDSDFIDLKSSVGWQRRIFAPALLGMGIAAGITINSLFIQRPSPPEMGATVAVQPPAPPIASQVSSPDQLGERLAATRTWLGSQPASSLSIQVMGSNDIGKLQAYLKQISDIIEIQNVYVYRTKAKGKPSYTLLYGTYNNRAAAMKAIASLPPSLAAFRPYLRSIQGIRAEVGQAETGQNDTP
jgi:septal ring-binding cell division protein DamX